MQSSCSWNQHVAGTTKDERLKEVLLILGALKKKKKKKVKGNLDGFHLFISSAVISIKNFANCFREKNEIV